MGAQLPPFEADSAPDPAAHGGGDGGGTEVLRHTEIAAVLHHGAACLHK